MLAEGYVLVDVLYIRFDRHGHMRAPVHLVHHMPYVTTVEFTNIDGTAQVTAQFLLRDECKTNARSVAN